MTDAQGNEDAVVNDAGAHRVVDLLRHLGSDLAAATTVHDISAATVRAAVQAVNGRAGRVLLGDEAGTFLEVAAVPDEDLIHGTGGAGDGHPPTATPQASTALATQLIGAGPGDDAFATRPTPGELRVPLATGGVTLGALVVDVPPGSQPTETDVALVEVVALQCAQALGRVLPAEPRSTATGGAEELTAGAAGWTEGQRQKFLDQVSSVLAEDLHLGGTMARLADSAVPWLGDWCLVYVAPTGSDVGPLAVSHRDPGASANKQVLHDRWPVALSADAGVGAVLRTGRSVVRRPSPGAEPDGVASREGYVETLGELQVGAAAVVPIRLGDQMLGAVELITRQGRDLSDADVALAEDLAARAATPLQNALEHEHRGRMIEGLQTGLRPARLPVIPGVDLAADYAVAATGLGVGGDFYDAFPVDGSRWMVAVGDVRGRGVHAAAVTGLARATIRAIASQGQDPSAVLGTLNRMLLDTEHDYADEAVSVPRFCTALLIRIEPAPEGVTATICAGGHPLPYLVTPGGNVCEVGTPGTLLGALDEAELHERTILLSPGHTLLAVTDGILERRDRHNRFFEDYLVDTLAAAAGSHVRALVRQVRTAVERFTDDRPKDDMAAIAIQARDPHRRSSP